ncbi:hypothetical protein GGR28_000859 [Lewinella aquimaris]|uniref:DUF5683 domain-containing protein n=1 Tax=Neolewinella aquimaris TaxID=1835722 RepID=A0A840E866_9BACT|nr:DUF5683 domain-containing protein [Neolewinella aquimaris]MBB4078258.1 hypothetical protein [Neolewinella aquimaris]
MRPARTLWWATLLALLLVVAIAPASAQNMPTDSVRTLQDINRGPKRALLWSIIPGGGQVYNKAWWKVPLVYSGLLGVVAVADYNQTQYQRFVTALEARCLGDGNVIVIPNAECIPKESEFSVDEVTSQALVTARNNANRTRQTAYFGILGVYILQAVEAFTDAHLRDFDISDDLSIRIAPTVSPGGLAGAGLTVPLGSGKRRKAEEARARLLAR